MSMIWQELWLRYTWWTHLLTYYNNMHQVTAELESVKAEMDEKGTSMTDSGEAGMIDAIY